MKRLRVSLLVIGLLLAGTQVRAHLTPGSLEQSPCPAGGNCSVNGTVNVTTFGAKCDGASGDDIATHGNTNLTSAADRWTSADVGKLIRVLNVHSAEHLYTQVSTTVGDANHITVTTVPDYAKTGNGIVDFTRHGATVTWTDCTWGTSTGAVACPDVNAFPISAPAMWDGNWSIKLHSAKAGNFNSTITGYTNARSITVAAIPALTKSAKVALWVTDSGTSINNALFSFSNNIFAAEAITGRVIVPQGVCATTQKLNVYGSIDFGGQGAGGEPYMTTSGDEAPPTSALVSFIPTPATLTITAITNPSTGIALVTTSGLHGLEEGQAVEITGVTPTGFNSPVDGYWTVKSLVSSTSFQIYIPTSSTLLSDGATGTVQPRVSMIEANPYFMGGGYPPLTYGPSYFTSVHDFMLVGDSTNPPADAVHFNGNGGLRFGSAFNLAIGTNPALYGVPPASGDAGAMRQFISGIGMTGADASPMIVANVDAHSYGYKCLDRSTNVSFSTFTADRVQCKSDNTYGSLGMDLNGTSYVTSSAIVQTAGAAFVVENGAVVIGSNNTIEQNGQYITLLNESSLGHSISLSGGDVLLCAQANAYDGVEVLHTITQGPASIELDKDVNVSSCVGASRIYTGPAFTWAFAPPANAHFTLLLNNINSISTHLFLTSSLNIVPTSSQNSDMLLHGQFRSGETDNFQTPVFQNWLNSPNGIVSFGRYDHGQVDVTADNVNVAHGAPVTLGDVMAMGHSVGQLTVAQLPSFPNIVKGLVPSTPMAGVTCGGYWRMGEAAGNLTDSCNANTATGAGGRTYSVTGGVIDDPNTAITLNGSTGTFSVASNASLPSNGNWTVCAGFKKALNGTLMQIIGQKADGFSLNSSINNFINIGQVGTGVVSVQGFSPITDANYHAICASSTASIVTMVLDLSPGAVLVTLTPPMFAPADATLYFGADRGTSAFWNGTLDELYITKTPLSVEQMGSIQQEFFARKYGRIMFATNGTIGVAGALLLNGGTGAFAAYNATGTWVGTGY